MATSLPPPRYKRARLGKTSMAQDHGQVRPDWTVQYRELLRGQPKGSNRTPPGLVQRCTELADLNLPGLWKTELGHWMLAPYIECVKRWYFKHWTGRPGPDIATMMAASLRATPDFVLSSPQWKERLDREKLSLSDLMKSPAFRHEKPPITYTFELFILDRWIDDRTNGNCPPLALLNHRAIRDIAVLSGVLAMNQDVDWVRIQIYRWGLKPCPFPLISAIEKCGRGYRLSPGKG